jgi:hypothetical protein
MLIATGGAALMTTIKFISSIPTAVDHELCWSCGQRNQHKLWCPNR